MLNPNKINASHAGNDATCNAIYFAFHAARMEAATRAALPRSVGPQRAALTGLIDSCNRVWSVMAPRAFDAI